MFQHKLPQEVKDKGTLLIVDDEVHNRTIYSRLFTGEGYKVFTSTSSNDTLQLLEETTPDLVLLDIILGPESGLDVLKKIKENPANRFTYIIMITGKLVSSDDQSLGLEMGAEGYIIRPVENRELLARVEAFMRHKNTIDSLRNSEARLTKIIEKNPDAIVIVDQHGKINFANPAAENIFGLSVNELTGRLFEYPLEEDSQMEITIDREDKSEPVTAEIRVIEITWETQQFYLAFIKDISQRRKMEKELKIYHENLEAKIEQRTAEILAKNEELEKMNDIFVGREFRVKELKDKIKELESLLEKLQ